MLSIQNKQLQYEEDQAYRRVLGCSTLGLFHLRNAINAIKEASGDTGIDEAWNALDDAESALLQAGGAAADHLGEWAPE